MTKGSLQDKISRFLFSYRNTPQGTTLATPAELLLGRKPRSPLDLLKPDLHRRVEDHQESQKEAHDQHSRLRSLKPGDPVYAKNFGHDATINQWLSGHIEQQNGPHGFRVLLQDGRVIRRHLDHLRLRTDSVQPAEHLPSTAVFTWDTSAPETFADTLPIASPDSRPGGDSPHAETDSDSVSHSSDSASDSPRYPSRNRRPPDRYAPYISH